MQRNWVMDSECTYYMCLVKDFFETLKLKKNGVMLFDNNKACKVEGMGIAHLRIFDNREILLQDVQYVFGLKRNVLSISMFDDLGYSTKIEHGMMKIFNDVLIVVKETKRNSLYIFMVIMLLFMHL
uniref:Retrovirus-related Pol polyprotein from transposon TNT 1-94-like beta-barrel domain-containing protein n=1 Tax=Cajanus cajan TaxID=3821 RepID=A0A151S8J9_CAJCA|nr:hypothetical protein KK1_027151 [Cajanus cajan]